jgi:capsular exopolysaccharide synthesis family protein
MKWIRKSRHTKPDHLSTVFLQNQDAKSRFAEAYRTLHTNIHYTFMEKGFKSILITSSGQAEGKTSTAANLGYILSQLGRTVLLIDADLRKPRLCQLAEGQESTGLTGILADIFSTEVHDGQLADMGIRDILRLLLFQKKNGCLLLANGQEKVEIYFLHGDVVDLNWLTRPAGSRLASVLVKSGLLSAQQAEMALRCQKDTDQKLAYILINLGMLPQEKLVGPLSIHMLEGLRTALRFKTGTYAFKEMAETDFDRATFDPVDFKQLEKQLTVGGEEIPFLQDKINGAILKTDVENLSLLPAGNLPPNPMELLSSASMSFLLEYLKKRFDVLVIDTAPILPASDALMLAPQTDGVIMVVKPGMIARDVIQKTIEQLRLTQANVLGVVLNQMDIRREGHYKYYNKYYSAYYGDTA